MKSLNIIKTMTLAFLGAALFVPLTATAQERLLFAEADTVGSLLNRTNIRFAELVEQRAGGAIEINHVQGTQLGNDTQVIEQMIEGTVDIYGDVLGWYAKWEDDFNILNWGFTFDDANHMQKFLESNLLPILPSVCAVAITSIFSPLPLRKRGYYSLSLWSNHRRICAGLRCGCRGFRPMFCFGKL